MTVLRSALGLVVGLILGGCGGETHYRYALTLDVETPQGNRSYETVREVTASDFMMMSAPNAPGMEVKLEGEAMVMDLPGGETVFALLGKGLDKYPENFALPRNRTARSGMEAMRAKRAITGRHDVPQLIEGPGGEARQIWPQLVRFADPGDPMTIKVVSPDALPGGGRVRRVTVQITDRPVMRGISDRLVWLKPGRS